MRPSTRCAPRAVRLNCEVLEDRVTPVIAYVLSGTNLLSFDTATPTVSTTIGITGVSASEALVGIDFRPQNGLLYGLGVNPTTDTATLYAISTRTGIAGVVGSPGRIGFTPDGMVATQLPNPVVGFGYGFDFNPATDLIRVVARSLNFRVDPNTGDPVDGDNTGATSGVVPGINPDGAINGATTNLEGSAFTNNQPNGNITTLYTLNAATDSLYIQSNPNSGATALVAALTLNGSPLNFTAFTGFDIPAGVNATTNNTAVTTGSGFAVLNVGGLSQLYTINLTNGQATLLGTVGTGELPISGFAVQSDLGGFPAIGLDAAGTSLVRFNTSTPGTTTTVPINGITAGDTLVALDMRPRTGQLYALGINFTTNAIRLYLVSPQNVSAAGVDTASVTPINPGLTLIFTADVTASDGYGFDFDPSADQIRGTVDTLSVPGKGLHFRLNLDGTAVNGDDFINGSGSEGVSAVAYTNNFGQNGGATTLYTLDSTLDRLFIQNAPDSGTQTLGKPVTLNGAPLNFTAVNGFDIPAGVISTNNGVANGFGYATLVGSGTAGLYRINLATGAATFLGATAAVSGLALGDAPGGVVSFQSATVTGTEGGSGVNVVLTRTGGRGAQTATVDITGGSATGGADFPAGPYLVTFVDGATTATLTIPFTSDGLTEGSETLSLAITAVSGGLIGTQANTTLTVSDPPAPPVPKLLPAFDNALVVGNLLVLVGSSLPGGLALVPVSPGSFALFADINGDGRGDVILGLPNLVAVLDGQSGRLALLATDLNSDRFMDIQMFNPDGTTTTDGCTGLTRVF